MSMKLIELRARNAKVIIAPTYGIDLAVYIKSHTNAELVIHSDQPHLEDCIRRMNCMFIQFNKETSMPTPWICRLIHHFHGKGRRPQHRYKNLFDGCHPNEELRKQIASLILKALDTVKLN